MLRKGVSVAKKISRLVKKISTNWCETKSKKNKAAKALIGFVKTKNKTKKQEYKNQS
jgi:hypothetical protein